ncbi:MAG: hypothetical protein CMM48_17845 [Rhodospirillaceae bacterium]|nr:hypothetical protein [Rhodospirillaceae bacterium]HAA91588.1 hypothetical protein [Rhodospirillaceae bacterium]|tara:strand:+ start:630 stop:815 length:186 start_codon:yes stop_codon:yes gene_type:complete
MDDIAAASALAGRLQASIFTLRLQLQQEATTATIVEEAVQSAAESAAVGPDGGSKLVDILV